MWQLSDNLLSHLVRIKVWLDELTRYSSAGLSVDVNSPAADSAFNLISPRFVTHYGVLLLCNIRVIELALDHTCITTEPRYRARKRQTAKLWDFNVCHHVSEVLWKSLQSIPLSYNCETQDWTEHIIIVSRIFSRAIDSHRPVTLKPDNVAVLW